MAEEALRRLITERLEKAERFLRTGQSAFRAGDYESAVSRAYYGVIHSIVALLPRLENAGGGLPSHPEIINQCVEWNRRYTRLNQAGFIEGHKDLRSSLEVLQRWREEADYKRGSTNREIARRGLAFARRFHNAIKEILL